MPKSKRPTIPVIETWDVASDSDQSKFYTISQTEDGTYSCTCMAWRYTRNDEYGRKPPCKHIRAVANRPGFVDRFDRIAQTQAEYNRYQDSIYRQLVTDQGLAEVRARQRGEELRREILRLENELATARRELARLEHPAAAAVESVTVAGESFTVRRKFRLDTA